MFYWIVFYYVVIWGSIIYYFCFIVVMYVSFFNYTYEGVVYQVFFLVQFWFILFLICIILLLFIIVYRFYYIDVYLIFTERIRFKQRLTKFKLRFKDFYIRRVLTFRRSIRFLRFGYVFVYQEGFGEFIISGFNMRQRVEKSEYKNLVELIKVSKIDSVFLFFYNDFYVENNNFNSVFNVVIGDSGFIEGVEVNYNFFYFYYYDLDRYVVFCEKF